MLSAASIESVLRRMRPAHSQRTWATGTIQRVGIALILSAVAIPCVDIFLVAAWLCLVVLNEYVLRPIVFVRVIEPLSHSQPTRARYFGLSMGVLATCLWATLPSAIWLSGPSFGVSLALLAFAAILLHVVILFPRDRLVIISPYVLLLITLPFVTYGATWNGLLLALGVVMFLMSVMIGVADRDRLVATLREKDLQRRSAESTSLQKSQFMATMSHELRTPLNAIIGYSELLMEDADDASKHDLGRILGAAGHLLRLVNQVLDLSSIDSGQMHINVERIDISALAKKVLSSMAEAPGRGETRIELIATHADAHALGDRDRIEHCLTELLTNACSFGTGSTVMLRLKATPSQVMFEITDTGAGLSMEQIGLLFHPFVQLDAGMTRRHDGMGLGLVLVQKLARLMGGDVLVMSELGQGSVFTLSLPRASPA